MLTVYVPTDFSLKKVDVTDITALPENAVWIDLIKPSPGEDRAVEQLPGRTCRKSRFPAASISRAARAT